MLCDTAKVCCAPKKSYVQQHGQSRVMLRSRSMVVSSDTAKACYALHDTMRMRRRGEHDCFQQHAEIVLRVERHDMIVSGDMVGLCHVLKDAAQM